jgi:secreted PhoX family phosphatase
MTDLPTPPAEGAGAPDALSGKLTGITRRSFIRAIAAAGVSTVAGTALARAGLAPEDAAAALTNQPLAQFEAIAPSSADRLELPAGFRAEVLIRYGDTFQNDAGEALTYGYNNDFLAYFALQGSNEGLLFVNHEYPAPFFQHGYRTDGSPKTAEQVQLEQDGVGNSVLHVRREESGWRLVSPSRYNRRVYGDRPVFQFTGPLAGDPRLAGRANGSVANCSGGTTPWDTALSCEENYENYGRPLKAGDDSAYGWPSTGRPEDQEYDPVSHAKYGWVCEHDPYDPSDVPRKHTALGRFRHENAAFRQVAGKRFVLYMGDDKAGEGVYKFVSDRAFVAGRAADNRRILERGTLYIARWEPEGRRRFANRGDLNPVTPTQGTGTWVRVEESELDDTAARLRARFGAEYDLHFGTNRPEDVEVGPDGSVWVALTNNTSVNDSHGSVRRLVEDGDDPEAMSFRWADFAAGGPTDEQAAGGTGVGFSSPDNLAFDQAGNLWVVTDISSGRLNRNEYAFHANNAMFMVPQSGPNAGVAFRFANMPVEAEGTGPYFTPDERTLFLNVQHPGEETGNLAVADIADPSTFTSWWPRGDRTAGRDPSIPLPATVVITRVS